MWRFKLLAFAVIMTGPALGAEPTFFSGTEQWRVFQHNVGDVLTHVRVNAALDAVTAKRDFPTALSLRVAFKISTIRPAPSKTEQAEFEEIEDEISNRLGSGNTGHFAAVVTGGSVREFLIYVTTQNQGVEFSKALAADIKHHDIDYQTTNDPDWSAWQNLISSQAKSR